MGHGGLRWTCINTGTFTLFKWGLLVGTYTPLCQAHVQLKIWFVPQFSLMKATQKYTREGGREGHKWLVFTECRGSHIFSSMPNKHGIKKKLKSSLEDPVAHIYFSHLSPPKFQHEYRFVYLLHKTWHVNKWHASQTQLGHVIDEHIHNLFIKYGCLFLSFLVKSWHSSLGFWSCWAALHK